MKKLLLIPILCVVIAIVCLLNFSHPAQEQTYAINDSNVIISNAVEINHVDEVHSVYHQSSQNTRVDELKTRCAVNCLFLVNEYYAIKVAYNELLHLINPGKIGTSLKTLSSVASSLGYSVRAVEIKSDNLLAFDGPFIAHLPYKDGYLDVMTAGSEIKVGHYVVVVPDPQKHGATIYDPPKGKQWVKQKDFEKANIPVMVLLLKPR